MVVPMHSQSSRQIPGKKKAENPHYTKDIRYTLQMCGWFLKPMGLWSIVYHSPSTWEKIASVILFPCGVIVMLFCILPPGRYMIFGVKDMVARVRLGGMVGTCVAGSIKYVYLGLRGTSFGNCIKQVERGWKAVVDPSYRAIMLRQVSTSRNLIRASAAILYTGGAFLHILLPVIAKVTSKGNVTVKPAIFLGYDFLLDSEFSYAPDLITVIQSMGAFMKYSITTCAYSLTTIFVTHIVGQIQIQISRLNDYVNNRRVKDHDLIGTIIRDHVDILRFAKNMQESFYEICLVQLTESTLIICFLAYCLMLDWEDGITINTSSVTHSMLLLSFIFNLFIFCYVGEMLSEQCSQIGPTAYNIEWYNLPPKQARNLIMLCTISLYPPKLTGGKMIQFCMMTFSSVMQTSVVYLNLLRTLSEW
ncbi:odorant receptor 13a-like [Andrena cerasifolii]|uniref:odorant receptor 13a-like n=1 Tax=Andrena cerasifolii TaxID=2819439 RepID=UPI0040379825